MPPGLGSLGNKVSNSVGGAVGGVASHIPGMSAIGNRFQGDMNRIPGMGGFGRRMGIPQMGGNMGGAMPTPDNPNPSPDNAPAAQGMVQPPSFMGNDNPSGMMGGMRYGGGRMPRFGGGYGGGMGRMHMMGGGGMFPQGNFGGGMFGNSAPQMQGGNDMAGGAAPYQAAPNTGQNLWSAYNNMRMPNRMVG